MSGGHQRLMFLMFAIFLVLLGIGIYQEACEIKEIKQEAPRHLATQCVAGEDHPGQAGFYYQSLGERLEIDPGAFDHTGGAFQHASHTPGAREERAKRDRKSRKWRDTALRCLGFTRQSRLLNHLYI